MARNHEIGRALDGAFSVRTVDRQRVNDQLVVTLEATPRWWSWRYWLFLFRLSRSSNWSEV